MYTEILKWHLYLFIFPGDTLFQGGCGRFFEGTAEQMHHALITVLGTLPDDTVYFNCYCLLNFYELKFCHFECLQKVYCGHEYSLQNLAFGHHVEPENQDIIKRIAWAREQREKSQPTVPSLLSDEKKINPFMRVNESTVQSHAKETEPIATKKSLRTKKDSFKA